MAKINLRATGGLDKDSDLNYIQEGDYISASNIVLDTGKTGGANAIKMLESIDVVSAIPQTSGTLKATFQNSDGNIYKLYAGVTTATIYRVNQALSTISTILTYNHGVSTDFVPDLKVVGDLLVWNYCQEGKPLSFALTRTTPVVFNNISDLSLVKPTPNNVFAIRKTSNGSSLEFMEANDFQFAARYQYDSGEYSALSAYSQMFKAEKGAKGYDIQYTWSGIPAYARYVELYVRIGNTGIWRKCDTVEIPSPATGTSTTVWKGELFESLETKVTSKPFDAIPVYAKHIEIAKNRIFLGNLKDDYDVASSALDFTISTSNGYALGNGNYTSYLGANKDANSSESSYSGTDYTKPFANNSTYAIGLAYYDENMKTRGVEKYVKFTTGKFALPILPDVTVSLGGGYAAPSWAKFVQLLYTKNISKSYIYEGFASNIFFELNVIEVNEITKERREYKTYSQNVANDQLKDVTAFVVDLMGMFRAGSIYRFEPGDKLSINTPNGVLDLDITAQNNNLLFCKYSGGAMTLPETPVPANLYFEIYTPKQIQEDQDLLFFEYGNMIPISSWSGGTFTGAGALNSTKIIGDMVYSKLELPVYNNAPFLYNTQKTVPSVVTEDVVTVVNGITSQTLQSSLTNSGTASDVKFTPTLAFGANGDGAVLLGTNDSFKLTGYYEIGQQDAATNKVSVAFSLISTNTLTLNPAVTNAVGFMTWRLTAQMYRTPYNNKDNKYELTEKFGQEFTVDERTFSDAVAGATVNINTSYSINLSTDLKKDINANDKFTIELKLAMSCDGDITAGIVNIAKQGASTYGMVMTINGDRTATKTISTYNSNAEVAAQKQNFIVRSVSNAIVNQFWNTSAGKPSVAAKERTSSARPNTIRHGDTYVAGTKINNVNSFYALDSNDVPVENGQITSLQRASRLQGAGSMLLALCERECSYIFLGEQELSQGNNLTVRSITSNVIGTIRNLGDGLGLLNKRSVFNYKGTIYWWDDFNKKIIEFTEQGISSIGDIGMRSFFLGKSGVAIFSYDPYYNMLFVSIGGDTTSAGYSVVRKRWIAETYSFKPDFAESFGDKMILFKNGYVYRSLGTTYNTFFGTAYDSTIQFMANTKIPVYPMNVVVNHDSAVVDYSQSNGVKATLMRIDISNENNQATSIVESNFLMEDNKLYAHVMRDSNSTGGLINGNYIVGFLNKFLLTLRDRTQNMRVNSLDVEIEKVSGHS